MRVIAGITKGRKLFAPKVKDLRPTTDRVKETLFNILGDVVKDASVLDLYAGIGSLGIEALSRGAHFIIFIENNKVVFNYLKRNLELTGFSDKAKTLPINVEKILKQFIRDKRAFDLIFIDPPYKIDFDKLIEILKDCSLILNPEGLVVLEHSKEFYAHSVEGLICVKNRKFGNTCVSIYKIKSEGESS